MQTHTEQPAPLVQAQPFGSVQGWTRYLSCARNGYTTPGLPVGKNEVYVDSCTKPGEAPDVVLCVNSGNFGLQMYPSPTAARAIAAALLLAADAVEAAQAAQAVATAPEAVPA